MNNQLSYPSNGIIIPGQTYGSTSIIDQPKPVNIDPKTRKLYERYNDLNRNVSEVGLEKLRKLALNLNRKETKGPSLIQTSIGAKHVVEFSIPPLQGQNPIFLVKHKSKDGEIVSYLKFPVDDPESMITLERLMWKISKYMKVSEYFVPTKAVKIPFKYESFAYATMQPEVKGILVGRSKIEENDTPLQISQHELAMGVFVSILFGMYDAHSKNILLKDGRVRFFDNAQSLPNSNGFIRWNYHNCLRSSYRCGLLDLEGSRVPLDAKVVGDLLEKAKECRGNIGSISSYLQTYFKDSLRKEGRDKLSKLWLDDESVIGSMKQRLDLIVEALENTKEINLIDLAVKANTGYLLAFGIDFLANLHAKRAVLTREVLIERSNHHHSLVSNPITSKLMNDLVGYGYDLQRLIDLSVEAVSFTDFIEKLVDYYIEFKKAPRSVSKHMLAIESMYHGVKYDLKEASEDNLLANTRIQENLSRLEKMGIPHVCLPGNSNECFDVPYESFILSNLHEIKMAIAFRTKFGLILRPINLSRSLNEISYVHPEHGPVLIQMTKQGLELLKNSVISDPHEFPRHPPEGSDLFSYGNRFQFTFQDNQLFLHINTGDGKVAVRKMEYSAKDQSLVFQGVKGKTLKGFLSHLEINELK